MLTICTPDLVKVDMIEAYSSLQWIRRYQEPGAFELHTTPHPYLAVGNLLYKDREPAIIENVVYNLDDKGVESAVVSGKFATKYLTRRIIYGTEIFSGQKSEVAMRKIVQDYAIQPTPPSWAIPDLILGEIKGFTQVITCQMSYASLTDAITNIAVAAGLGYRITIDPAARKLIF